MNRPGVLPRRQTANLVTAARFLLTPFFLLSIWQAGGARDTWVPAFLYVLIVATDYGDGRVARRMGITSRIGRIFDHTADIVFLLSALLTYVALGLAPWWVPAAIGASFVFYMLDSRYRPEGTGARFHLRGSWLGHAGGVLNYALVGCLAFDRTAGLRILPDALLSVLFAAVPVYSGASILQRLSAR